jgi:hypothetical protein
MKKKLFILTVVGLAVCLVGFVTVASANDKDTNGKSKPGHLYLYQKIVPTDVVCIDPYDLTTTYSSYPCSEVNDQNWDIVRHGGRGTLEYKFLGPIFNFEFEGHGLVPGESYTLIYYPDNWQSGMGLIYLGSDVAKGHGNVHIAGSLDIGDLPALYDDNSRTNPPGAKIWLVLSSDMCFRSVNYFDAPKMIKWNPDKYLFADEFITFDSPVDRDCDTGS